MKVLFVMRHPAAVRSLGSVLRLLDAHGHEVHLAFRRIKTGDSHRVLWELAEECNGLTFGRLPGRGSPGWVRGREGWDAVGEQLRFDSDFLRYLEPAYADASGLRARAARQADPYVHRLARVARLAGTPGIRALRGTLEWIERCLTPPPHIERFIADFRPDVLLVTHLAELGSSQSDYVRAAARLGVHTGYPVFSWDNLTNKGLVHDLPELVLVWNDLQATEAAELQGIPRGRVRVTGASAYDHWFEWKPSRTREELCQEVGLRPDRPIILYVCSSHFVAPEEVGFIRRWVGALRAHGGALAEAGVIVRPHPRNATQWGRSSLDLPQVAVWPRFGEEPLEESSRQNYFDSIYHSAAVVGINTSAQIESAIVGRPVHTVLADEFRETQQGTLHFQYLKADGFGHLYVGRTMEEHLDQLDASLAGDADAGRNERFLRRFVRPLGLDVKASPVVVEALEELAARPAPARDPGPALAPLVRLVLRPVVRAAAGRHTERRRTKVKTLTPTDELRRTVRKLGRAQDGPPVAAGPWLGDEVAELLYWIPFLRWSQVVTFGLRTRMVVLCRPSNAAWYEGIGGRRLEAEEPATPESVRQALGVDEALLLPASLIDGLRADLAQHRPGERPLNRPLEFAAMPVADVPADLGLPGEFTAVRFSYGEAFPRTRQNEEIAAATVGALAEHGPVVVIAPALEPAPAEEGGVTLVETSDPRVEEAIVARARGFAGSYGPLPYLASLAGCPAVALYSSPDHVAEEDIRLASASFAWAPFGPFNALEAGGRAAEVSERAATLLREAADTLAPA